MGRLLSLGFEFMGTRQQTLIRVKEEEARVEYCITVLNAELEELLVGNNIIIEEDNRLKIDMTAQQDEQAMLKKAIATALGKYLNRQL